MNQIPNLTRIVAMGAPVLRRPVPQDWLRVIVNTRAHAFEHRCGLCVLMSLDTMDDGTRWLHVSVSRAERLPTWDELKLVKDSFIGRNHEAVQVLPRDTDYVNAHQYCLHLWSPEP